MERGIWEDNSTFRRRVWRGGAANRASQARGFGVRGSNWRGIKCEAGVLVLDKGRWGQWGRSSTEPGPNPSWTSWGWESGAFSGASFPFGSWNESPFPFPFLFCYCCQQIPGWAAALLLWFTQLLCGAEVHVVNLMCYLSEWHTHQ